MPVSGTKVRLLLGEDNIDILRETRALLSEEFDLVATAEDGIRLVAAAQKSRPDVVVTDISMPELNGIEASRRILELGCCKAVVILSVTNSPEIVITAFDAGIRGYVLKENAGEELISAIHSAVQGRVFLSSGIASALLRKRGSESRS